MWSAPWPLNILSWRRANCSSKKNKSDPLQCSDTKLQHDLQRILFAYAKRRNYCNKIKCLCFLYLYTEHCHRVETQLQLIIIIIIIIINVKIGLDIKRAVDTYPLYRVIMAHLIFSSDKHTSRYKTVYEAHSRLPLLLTGVLIPWGHKTRFRTSYTTLLLLLLLLLIMLCICVLVQATYKECSVTATNLLLFDICKSYIVHVL
jgi:uncharacterized membrane protein